MGAIDDITGIGNAVSIDPVTSATTSTSTGSGIDIRDYIGRMAIMLDADNNSGTTPTMDVKIQESADDSTYSDISGATFTQVTTTASFQQIALDVDSTKRYIRAVSTLAGTSPSYTYSITGYGAKKTG